MRFLRWLHREPVIVQQLNLEELLLHAEPDERASIAYRYAGEADIPDIYLDQGIKFYEHTEPAKAVRIAWLSGKQARAISIYGHAGHFSSAARLAGRIGERELEIKLLREGHLMLTAARRARGYGMRDVAMELYEHLRALSEAADYAESIGKPKTALQLNLDAGNYSYASRLAERLGLPDIAIGAMEEASRKGPSYRLKYREKAARLAVKYNQPRRAIDNFMEADRVMDAVDVAKKQGWVEITLELMEKHHLNNRAGDYCMQNGLPLRALQNYVEGLHIQKAMEVLSTLEVTPEVRSIGMHLISEMREDFLFRDDIPYVMNYLGLKPEEIRPAA